MKIAILLSLTILVLSYQSNAEGNNPATSPIPREEDVCKERFDLLKQQVANGDPDIIFLGDSITHGWDGEGKDVWARYYVKRNALNLGIAGDRTEHLLYRLENGQVDGISPKLAVVLIGVNNGRICTAAQIAEGITKVVSTLREKLSSTKILLLGIFPAGAELGEDRTLIYNTNRLACIANADGDMVHYLDIGSVFLEEDGHLPESVMPDFLHPSAKGYELWADAIEPKIVELLGETKPQSEEGFVPLFDNGWDQVGGDKKVWKIADEILYTTGKEGGWISSKKEYSNFELALEFRVPESGNSGVFIRAPREGNPAFEGMEIQVLDDYAVVYDGLQPYQFCGGLYSITAPKVRATLPAGIWQKMRIRCDGTNISVALNGYPISQTDLAVAKSHTEAHPGMKREKGYIGLQNHGSRLDFRNVRIREIK